MTNRRRPFAPSLLLLLGSCATAEVADPDLILSFVAAPSRGEAPLSVTFTWDVDFVSGDPLFSTTTCDFAFGDGATERVAPCPPQGSTSHTYATPGGYTARLDAREVVPENIDEASAYVDQADVPVEVTAPVPSRLQVSIQSVNDGQGSVASDIPGIICNSTGTATDCDEDYPRHTAVGLIPAALNGSQFDGWQGDCTGTGSCALVMDGDKSVTATFSRAPAPGTVSVSVRDDAGNPVAPDAAAYRIADGPWSTLIPLSLGDFRVDVPSGEERFGVMVRCGMFLQTVEATTDETTTLRIPCASTAPAAGVGFAWSGVDSLGTGTAYRVELRSAALLPTIRPGAMGGSTAPLPAVPQDVGLIGFVDNIPLGARILRGVTPAGGTTYQFPFTSADRGGSAMFTPFTNAPALSSGNVVVHYTTTGGLRVPVGNGFGAGGWYYTFPGGASSDAYVAFGIANYTGGYVTHASVVSQPATFAFDMLPTWDQFAPPAASAQPAFTNLDSNQPEHRGFTFGLSVTRGTGGFLTSTLVTCGWLGGATSYTIGDPGGLTGFTGFGLAAGDNVSYTAETLFGNQPVGAMFAAPRLFGTPIVPGLSLKSAARVGAFVVP